VAEQDDDVQACVCGCGTGGTLWNGLRELERGARGAETRRHMYAEVSARLSAMAQ
jgi:cysteine synthase